jgi:hypothetical protein
MTHVLADIATGKTQWAELFFIVALVLFLIATAVSLIAQSVWSAVLCAGLACVALAWVLL